MNKSEVANTITSVQKDSMVAESIIIDKPKYLEFRNFISLGEQNNSYNRVWKTDNYCGALNCTKQMEILEPQDTSETPSIPQVTKQSYIEVPHRIVFDMSYPESTTRRGRVQEGGQVSPTLMAGGEAPCYFEGVEPSVKNPLKGKSDNLVVEPLNPYKDGTCRTIKAQYQQSSRANFARQDGLGATGVVQMGNIYPNTDLETTKTKEFIEQVRGHEEMRYRIRKLTPREYFRLMGVDDEDIDKIQASGISNSQQYKMAGNSIVVDVLYHIFRKAFVQKENESPHLTFDF